MVLFSNENKKNGNGLRMGLETGTEKNKKTNIKNENGNDNGLQCVLPSLLFSTFSCKFEPDGASVAFHLTHAHN